MNIRQLHYFLQIAELKSFSRAGAVLHIAQPALSRSIRALEEELGVALFDRSERGVELTDAGELLRERAASLLADFAHVRDEVAARGKTLRGELAFGMPPSMQEIATVPLIRAFRATHPQVLLRLAEGISVALNEWTRTGRVDVAVVASAEPLGALARVPLLTEGMYLVGPRAAGLRLERPVSIERVAREPLIVTLRPNSLRALVETALARIGRTLEPVLEANATSAMIATVAAGDGFSVLPFCAVQRALAERRISAAPVQGLRTGWSIVHSRERPLSRTGRVFVETLRVIASDAIARGDWVSAKLD